MVRRVGGQRDQSCGCQRCGSSSSIRLFMCIGNCVSTSLRKAHGSCPQSLTDCTRLITTAARWPASSLPANNQALRLWAKEHDRNNANFPFMRSRASVPSGPALKTRLVASRRGSGRHIKTGISCGGNPTSGDRHGCVRFHSPGAGSLAARQRPGTVRAGLLVPLGRAVLRPRNGAHVPLRCRTLRTLVATAPA